MGEPGDGRERADRDVVEAITAAAASGLDGDLGGAERALLAIIEELDDAGRRQSVPAALARHHLADGYRHTGRVERAAPLHREALAIVRAVAPGSAAEATVLFGVGQWFVATGDLDRARRAHADALAIRRGVLAPTDALVVESLLGLAFVEQSAGALDAAEALLVEALERSAGHERLAAVAANNHAGVVFERDGWRAAAPRFAEALDLVRRAWGADHPSVAPVLGNLAECELAAGDAEAALRRWLAAAAIDDALIAAIGALASQAEREALAERAQHDLDAVATVVGSRPDLGAAGDLFDLVQRRKGFALEAAAVQRRILDHEPRVRAAAAELRRTEERVAAAALRSGSSPAAWSSLRRRCDDLEAAVAREVPELHVAARLRRADRRAIAGGLAPGMLLVEYVQFRPLHAGRRVSRGERRFDALHYAALALPAGRPDDVVMVDLGPAGPIDRLAGDFRAAVLAARPGAARTIGGGGPPGATTDWRAVGRALGAACVDPVAAATGGLPPHVVVAPAGALALVPFPVLPAADGRCLLHHHVVSHVDVGRDVLRWAVPAGAGGPPVVVADPDFGEAPGPPGPAPSFGPLPGARAEGTAVAERLGVPALVGPEARVDRIVGNPAPWVLHLATHGFFVDRPVRRLAVDAPGSDAPGSDRGGPQAVDLAAVDDPMLRSGLALAGANTWWAGGTSPAGTGVLLAADVARMDLSGTALAVLSACDTGLGRATRSEGVVGLRRALAVAGARAVVMSLWQVPDAATQQVVERFYALVLAGAPVAGALRTAQLDLAAVWPDRPAAWGGLICWGDPGPLGPAGPRP